MPSKKFIHKALAILISIFSILLLLVPYSYVFNPSFEGFGDDKWETVYIIHDFELSVCYLPFIILWFIYLFQKNKLIENVLAVVLSILSFLYGYFSFSSLTFIAQDNTPYIGVYISFVVCPLFFAYLINKYLLNKENTIAVQ